MVRTFALAGAVVALGAPAPAFAATPDGSKLVQILLGKYLTTGDIDACAYTVEELQAAADNVTSDVRQYASDFPAALRDALSARARGACEEETPTPGPTAAPTAAPTTAGGGAAPPPSGGSSGPAPDRSETQQVIPEPPAPDPIGMAPQVIASERDAEPVAATSPGNDAPVPLIGLGVLSALSLLTVMLLGALKRLGSGEGRLAPAYHSWREAQWRAGGVWDDFRDWLRVGR